MEMACAWPCHRCRAHDASHAACGLWGQSVESFVDHITVGCGKIQHASDREPCGATAELRGVARRGGRAAISCDGRRSRDAAGAGARGHDARDGGAGRGAGKASGTDPLYNLVRVYATNNS